MARNPELKSFYNSKEWKTFRLMLINERKNRCTHCGSIIADSSKITGHHKIELTVENVKDHSISLNPDLIELVCHDCHNKEHKRFGYRKPAQKKVILVYGPPLSGKTTFVRERKSRDDIVVDIDRIYEAITLLPAFDKPSHLIGNVMSMHNALIDNIRTRYGKWNNAWIVGGYPDKYKRNRLAEEVGAEVILCDVSKEECLIRLEKDKDRNYFNKEWKQYIDDWFEKHTE